MELDVDNAKVKHWNDTFNSWHYRKAVWRLIKAVHKINRKPLTNYSVDFEGVM
jgi:hypothetical protein